jgi:hypothetical protein
VLLIGSLLWMLREERRIRRALADLGPPLPWSTALYRQFVEAVCPEPPDHLAK